MQNLPRLKYHQATCDMLGISPQISRQAEALLAERERACSTTFPASLREWFSLEGASDIFSQYTNCDELADVQYLGDPEDLALGLLHVATENQGVLYWFARLDGSDDPPVCHDNNQIEIDDDGNWNLSEIELLPCALTFSVFLFSMMSGRDFAYGPQRYAWDKMPDEADLAALRRDFQEGPHSITGEWQVYRFFNRDASLVVRTDNPEEMAASKAHWILQTATEAAAEEQSRRLGRYGTLAQTLKPGSRPEVLTDF